MNAPREHNCSDHCEACYYDDHDRAVRADYIARWNHPDTRYLETSGTVIHRIDGGCYDLDRVLGLHNGPWSHTHRPLTRQQAIATGKRACLVCAPDIPAPPAPQRQLRRRLTGLGWPAEGSKCARGRLPAWTRRTA